MKITAFSFVCWLCRFKTKNDADAALLIPLRSHPTQHVICGKCLNALSKTCGRDSSTEAVANGFGKNDVATENAASKPVNVLVE